MKGGDTYEELDAEVQSKLSKFLCFNEVFGFVIRLFSPSIRFPQFSSKSDLR